MNASLQNEVFLLISSSRAFMGRDSSARRREWIDYRTPSQDVALVLQTLLGGAGVAILLNALTSAIARTPGPPTNLLLTGGVGTVLLVVAGLWAAHDSQKRASWQRLIRAGQVLPGTVLECTGEACCRTTEAETVSWYSVLVRYCFRTPSGREIRGQATAIRSPAACKAG